MSASKLPTMCQINIFQKVTMAGLIAGMTIAARFGHGDWSIYRDEPAEISCRLAADGKSPQYKQLVLGFGLEQGNSMLEGSTVVRFSVYQV